ncbi:hypothetical protein BASA83_001068 [Batrachochytrium salamandrivorans]|nr:hypothetical protein BASA81_012212 [Batrachochytrium salamandrivorans]KAH9276377.1 hypothetical protein BASA83_001068 [Batrachochytrium salamandrivorans]
MISSLAWVRKAAAQEIPGRVKLTDEEFARISAQMGDQLKLAKDDLEEMQGNADDQDDGEEGQGGNGTQEDSDVDMKAEVPETAGNGADSNELDIYNLNTYDDDEKEDSDGPDENGRVSLFSKVRGLAYYNSNKDDPFIELGGEEDDDEDEELEEMRISPTDNLIVAAKTEDDISHLEVYVYEEEEDNLYVHHDILLPSFPLCLEWLDFPVGRSSGQTTPGNYIAVGTFEPQVEIWNLDTIDSLFPDIILGAIPDSREGSIDNKKKKKKGGPLRIAKSANPERHVDAVMAISWNTVQRNLIATGSADATVKLWDMNRPSTAIASYNPHRNKVQAVRWNKVEPTVLLTGGYDKRVCAFDSRAPGTVASWKLTADVECLLWDPLHSERFLVSTEDGLVKAFDVRAGKTTTHTPGSGKKQSNTVESDNSETLFTLHAHDSAISAMDLSPLIDGLLVTGSSDKHVKVWSIKNDQPACIVSRDVDAGKVFSANFSPDSPYTLSLAGSKGRVVVWNLEDNSSVRRAFPIRQNGQALETMPKTPRKELVAMESDNEPEDDDEKDDMPINEEDFEEDGEDEDHV